MNENEHKINDLVLIARIRVFSSSSCHDGEVADEAVTPRMAEGSHTVGK